jgi:hypothetical protein
VTLNGATGLINEVFDFYNKQVKSADRMTLLKSNT